MYTVPSGYVIDVATARLYKFCPDEILFSLLFIENEVLPWQLTVAAHESKDAVLYS